MALESVTLPGTGEKVAADALAGGEVVQYVKLVSGAANSEVPIAAGGGTEANGLRVAPGVVTMTTLATTKSSSGDNAVVTTPGAGYRLVVSSFMTQNDASGARTLILRSGATTNGWRCRAQNRGDGLSKDFAAGREWRLNENEAMNLNLSAAGQCVVSVMYWTEAI